MSRGISPAPAHQPTQRGLPITLPPICHMQVPPPAPGGRSYKPAVFPWEGPTRYPYHESSSERSSTASCSPQSLPPLLPHIDQMAQPRRYTFSGQGETLPQIGSVLRPIRDKRAWMDYAQIIPGTSEQNDFRCMWPVGNSGQHADYCGYTAKRHLVKRHVETRHLQFK